MNQSLIDVFKSLEKYNSEDVETIIEESNILFYIRIRDNSDYHYCSATFHIDSESETFSVVPDMDVEDYIDIMTYGWETYYQDEYDDNFDEDDLEEKFEKEMEDECNSWISAHSYSHVSIGKLCDIIEEMIDDLLEEKDYDEPYEVCDVIDELDRLLTEYLKN